MGKMTKIKILNGGTAKAGEPLYVYNDGYSFTFDAACNDYDWLLVYDEMPRMTVGTLCGGYEPLVCPKERSILCTWEPISIKGYSRAYTRQFGHLLSNRPEGAEKHPHYHLGRGYFFWFVGRSREEILSFAMPKKTKTISAACSSKAMRHTKHFARVELMKKLANDIPDFGWFGKGIRPFDCKYEILDDYKYHVVVENHIGDHHWTEKLADAFLCECLPFYAGDPKIFEVFPQESLIEIPIDDPEAASRIIRKAIEDGEYEKRRGAILEAKKLILEKYNFWQQVIDVIESAKDQPITPVDPMRPVRIWNRKALRSRNLVAALEDGWGHLVQDVRRFSKVLKSERLRS